MKLAQAHGAGELHLSKRASRTGLSETPAGTKYSSLTRIIKDVVHRDTAPK